MKDVGSLKGSIAENNHDRLKILLRVVIPFCVFIAGGLVPSHRV